MKKRIKTLLVATLVASIMTACGSSTDTTSSSSNSGGTTSTADTSSTTTTETSTGTGSGIEFPLAEPMSFDFHYHARDKYVFDPSWPVFQEMERLTNISLVNQGNIVATNSVEQTQLQAVDKFPYDLYAGDNVSRYFMQYGLLGAFYPLNDYLDNLPHFTAFLEDNPKVEASITLGDGNMYHIPYIQDGKTARTYFIRMDWLENLGLEVPTTVEEYEDVLRAFKEQDANGNGNANDEIPYFNDKWYEMMRLVNLWDARCYAMDDYLERVIPNEDGTVYHAWVADEFRDAVVEISRWYDEGLIDREIFTKGTSSRKEYMPGNTGGSTHEWVPSTAQYNDTVDIDGFNFAVFAPPITASGNQWEEHQRLMVKADGWAVSTNCDSPAELFQYMDYFYSPEGRILSNWGIEGEHWEYVGDQPTFLPGILDGTITGGLAVNEYLESVVGAQLKHGYWMDYQYESQWTNPIGQEGIALYNEGDWGPVQMPSLSYTEEERNIYDTIVPSLVAIQDEWVQKVIVGPYTSVEASWDAYVKDCEANGLAQLLENYETALARYLANTGGQL